MKFESTNVLKKLLLLVFFISIDQFSKYLIRSQGGFYVCNPALALGLKVPDALFWIIWIIIILIIGLIILNFKFFPPERDPTKAAAIFNKFSINKFSNFQTFGLLLIFSGAISNIIDRLYFGCIIDFIDLKFWPVFNLADVFITAGVIMLIMQNVNFKMQNDK